MSDLPPLPREIHYAPVVERRFPWRRRLLQLLCVIAIAISFFEAGPRIYANLNARVWQWRCERYTAPASQVVFDADHLNVHIRTPYEHEQATLSPTDHIVFLHGRSAGSLTNQLVVVNALSVLSVNRSAYPATGNLSPALFAHVDGLHNEVSASFHWPLPPYQTHLRIFAGQADPGDPSHFTISYEIDGAAGMLDGWLRSDGSVLISPHNAQATQSSN